jgi:methionine-S-sulfoxide reductase
VSVAPLRVLALLTVLLLAGGAVAQDAPREDSGARAVATFAGGCFWCMEPPYDKLDGVISTTAGYAGGPERDPAYRDVAGGKTGHAEVVQVVYDPARVDYETLLRVFWRNIDPFAVDRQFCDAGPQYRTAIFYHDAAQRAAAEASLAEVAARFGQASRPGSSRWATPFTPPRRITRTTTSPTPSATAITASTAAATAGSSRSGAKKPAVEPLSSSAP